MTAHDTRHDGSSALRRALIHGLAFLGALLTASGAAGLLRVALESLAGPALVADTAEGLALGLSLVLVGLPLWLLSWRAAERAVGRAEAERHGLARRLHLVAVRLVALTIAALYAYDVGLWLLAVEGFEATAVARLVVWSAVWAYHERVAARAPLGAEPTGRLDRLHVYVVGAVGLLLLATAAGGLVSRSLGVLYDQLLRPEAVLLDGGAGLRTAVPGLLIGAGVWWWHWGVRATSDRGSTGWRVHVFLVGMLAPILAALSGAATLVYSPLAWALSAVDGGAVEHFAVVPTALAALLVGGAAWGYHRAVLLDAHDVEGRSGPQRAYEHLLVGIAVFTVAGGLATILALGLELASPGTTLSAATPLERRALAAGLTLLAIGAPVWAWMWHRIQRAARRDPGERTEGPRRALILGVLGLATLTSVSALGTLLYTSFQALFAGRFGLHVLVDQRWSLALLLTAGAIAAHYGLVLREDRRAAPASLPAPASSASPAPRPRPSGPDRLVVVASHPHELAAALSKRLQVDVVAWARHDAAAPTTAAGPAVAADPEALVERLRTIDAPEVLVLVEPDGSWTTVAVEALPHGPSVTVSAPRGRR